MKIEDFIRTAMTPCGYNPEIKRKFHSQGAAILRVLATLLDYKKGDYDLRHNQGGIAVSGEITLHSDTLYVQFSQSPTNHTGFLWRTCSDRKDYTGHFNQWAAWSDLVDLQGLADRMKAAMKKRVLLAAPANL
jgi:hypothetical protein